MENYISEIVRTLDIYGVMCVLEQHSGDDPGFLITCCLARIVYINILATLKSHSHFSFQEIVKIHLGGPCLYQKCLTWYYRLYLLEGWQCVARFNELQLQLCWADGRVWVLQRSHETIVLLNCTQWFYLFINLWQNRISTRTWLKTFDLKCVFWGEGSEI